VAHRLIKFIKFIKFIKHIFLYISLN
jgi:hypothetical protein